MGTVTAQILIGSPHPNDGGIIPSHYLFLSENDRPSWTLVRANIFQVSKNKFSKIVLGSLGSRYNSMESYMLLW